MIVMKSNRSKISKFLAAITLASSAMSSFNGCISGMEVKNSEKQKINDLSLKFLKSMETNEDYMIFSKVLNSFGGMLTLIDTNDIYDYKKEMTLGNFIDKAKNFMKNPNSKQFLDKRLTKVEQKIRKFVSEKFGSKYDKKKVDDYVDFIFDSISENINLKENITNDNIFTLCDLVTAVDSKIGKGWATKKQASGLVCTICQEKFTEEEFVNKQTVLTPCKHLFHKECLKEFMPYRQKCPNCKNVLTTTWVNEHLNIK